VPTSELLAAVKPLLARWAAERFRAEGLGDFYQRIVARSVARTAVTGRETPTFDLVQLQAAG
jgi:hypothetical protein